MEMNIVSDNDVNSAHKTTLINNLLIEEKANILTFSGLHSWTSDVEWHPRDSNLLVSSNYDGCLAIYDIRSSYAIHSVPHVHEGKVLCCVWKNTEEILTGMRF